MSKGVRRRLFEKEFIQTWANKDGEKSEFASRDCTKFISCRFKKCTVKIPSIEMFCSSHWHHVETHIKDKQPTEA